MEAKQHLKEYAIAIGLSPEEILQRNNNMAIIRNGLYFWLYHCCGYKWREVAVACERSISTVTHGSYRFEQRIEHDRKEMWAFAELKDKLNAEQKFLVAA